MFFLIKKKHFPSFNMPFYWYLTDFSFLSLGGGSGERRVCCLCVYVCLYIYIYIGGAEACKNNILARGHVDFFNVLICDSYCACAHFSSYLFFLVSFPILSFFFFYSLFL
ncbi:conserved hypothetical protein, unlikely [Trypanosoma brucei gambiense DAL972]|uniref:Uncharacterized protein n=1 Tax=Trypanosoma brucei gambiense (strain MHOM/CI/86/DAL972) TaxID=679716 RepID=C9ZYZ0_TRYB9|nr:conserved hypothetical protein, unlikely [Trypanosoma brucei gambiense DAL972]CBH14639.1 conserved hypothetical protein, unlikely [Trypanosoma brucei gambiense DAL972]|eukprot:XP_011776905.1 conserved hypothetical protein, unlikely [Trypanosoma brucei gambiense DAL972]